MATKTLVAASTKPLVLSILAHGENYGYQIIKEVEQISEGVLQWTDAMLYPVLGRMEKEGLIRSHWVKTEQGRRRKYYRITLLGEENLAQEKQQWLKVNYAFVRLWGLTDTPYSPTKA
ncbi:MAG: helix-turn-helix transcriptional regulator [Bacteroidota bacterium]